MLVLSRKSGESIRIGDDVSIMVVDIRSDRVRIGIDAPRHMTVLRQEIYEAIHQGESAEERAKDGAMEHSGGDGAGRRSQEVRPGSDSTLLDAVDEMLSAFESGHYTPLKVAGWRKVRDLHTKAHV